MGRAFIILLLLIFCVRLPGFNALPDTMDWDAGEGVPSIPEAAAAGVVGAVSLLARHSASYRPSPIGVTIDRSYDRSTAAPGGSG